MIKSNRLYEIQWWSLGNVGSLVQIDIYKGDTFSYTLADITLNDSLFMWMIPADQALGDDYRVRIQSHINSDVYAYSDTLEIVEFRRLFLIHPDTSNVICEPEDDLPSTWTSTGEIGSEVKIELYKGIQLNLIITEDTENDGEYIWPIPAS